MTYLPPLVNVDQSKELFIWEMGGDVCVMGSCIACMAPYTRKRFPAFLYCLLYLKGIENNQLLLETIQKRRKTFPCAPGLYLIFITFLYIWKERLPGCFLSRPGKAVSRFAQPGSRQKRLNFYHVDIPPRFAGTTLC